MIKTLRSLLAAGVLLVTSQLGHSFPDRQITVIVPFSAGTTTDVNARDFASVLSSEIGQPVVIDNRVGAEGIIGTQALLNAIPDGHTVMFTSNSLPVMDPLMKKNLPYDPVKDLAPVCSFARTSNVMNVTGSSPLKTAADVVAAAKAHPGKITFGYASAAQRLAGELFQQAAGIKLTGVPYRSSMTALTDVAGGQIDLVFIDHISAMAFYQGARVRPLAVAGSQRFKAIPEVPSATEIGVPGYQLQPWFAFYASAKTPPAVLAQLRSALKRALESPATTSNMEKRGLRPMVLCGDALARLQSEEISQTRDLVNKAGIQPE